MEKIIDGKLYSTSAEGVVEIVSVTNSHYSGDFKFCRETLYRTVNGRWFVAGVGGPLSKYAKSSGNGQSGGEDITALSPEEAAEWLIENQKIDLVQEYFPDEVDDA